VRLSWFDTAAVNAVGEVNMNNDDFCHLVNVTVFAILTRYDL